MKAAVCALAAFLAGAMPAAADPDAVRTTITGQLAAFASGDAAAAYDFAAPSIKQMFPTPERFIEMVRRGYAPVTQAQSPVFMRAKAVDADHYAQEVGFVDASGEAWTALYTLARQSDGSWRIDGCYLKKAAGIGA